MFEKLRIYLENRAKLTEEQYDFIRTLFIPKKMRKGEFLLRAGEVAQYGAFVTEGCLRSYVIDEKGKEHIVQFAPENWWLSDYNSARNNVPSIYFMDAIEPSQVLVA